VRLLKPDTKHIHTHTPQTNTVRKQKENFASPTGDWQQQQKANRIYSDFCSRVAHNMRGVMPVCCTHHRVSAARWAVAKAAGLARRWRGRRAEEAAKLLPIRGFPPSVKSRWLLAVASCARSSKVCYFSFYFSTRIHLISLFLFLSLSFSFSLSLSLSDLQQAAFTDLILRGTGGNRTWESNPNPRRQTESQKCD